MYKIKTSVKSNDRTVIGINNDKPTNFFIKNKDVIKYVFLGGNYKDISISKFEFGISLINN